MKDSLSKVAQLARRDEQSAAESARSQRGAVGNAQAQLEQLERFKQDYEQRLTAMAGGGMDARLLSDYRAFLARLNDAIGMQSQQVAQQREQLGERQSALRQKSVRRESVDTLIERHRADEARDAQRREQRLQDDSSGHRHRHGAVES